MAACVDELDRDVVLEDLERQEPGISKKLFTLYLQDTDLDFSHGTTASTPEARRHLIQAGLESYAQRYLDEVQPRRQQQPSISWVKQFVAQMEQAAQRESLVAADGKLHKPTFARLIKDYLLTVRTRRKTKVAAAYTVTPRRGSSRVANSYMSAAAGQAEMMTAVEEDEGENSSPDALQPSLVQSLIANLEAAAETEPFLHADGTLDGSVFERLVHQYLAAAAQQHSSSSRPDLSSAQKRIPKDPNFVRNFVAQLQRASELEPVFSPNGKLHKPAFEKLMLRYVEQAVPKSGRAFQTDVRSPLALARALQSARKPLRSARPSLEASGPALFESPAAVRRFVDYVERQVDRTQVLSSDGKLDGPALEAILDQCLADVPLDALEEHERMMANLQALDWTGFAEHFVSDMAHCDTAEIGEEHFREITASSFLRYLKDIELESVYIGESVEAFLDEFGKVMNDEWRAVAVFETSDGSLDTSLVKDRVLMAATKAADAAFWSDSSVPEHPTDPQHEMGDLMKMLQNTEQEELKAVAAFRKTQNQRRSTDDNSSLSSFRALPEGIKQVVKKFGRSHHHTDLDVTDSDSLLSSILPEETQVDFSSTFSGSNSGSGSEISAERLRRLHQQVMENSALLNDDHNHSIIDTDGSDVSQDRLDPNFLSNLLLSPTILTKRHQQAIRAIESRNWEQVAYLLSANPWLAEMTDLKSNQYLLHKLALYGTGLEDAAKAPGNVNTDLIRMFPAAVHKFDVDGNLPLHMATASANVEMINLLGDRFPSGASVRNEDGMLVSKLVYAAILSAGH